MNREELIGILEKLPPGTEIFTRSSDNAWPTTVRVFNSCNGVTAFMDYKSGEHRNFPEHYSGSVELTHEYVDGVTLESERYRILEQEFDDYDFGFETIEYRSKPQRISDCKYRIVFSFFESQAERHEFVVVFETNSTKVTKMTVVRWTN